MCRDPSATRRLRHVTWPADHPLQLFATAEAPELSARYSSSPSHCACTNTSSSAAEGDADAASSDAGSPAGSALQVRAENSGSCHWVAQMVWLRGGHDPTAASLRMQTHDQLPDQWRQAWLSWHCSPQQWQCSPQMQPAATLLVLLPNSPPTKFDPTPSAPATVRLTCRRPRTAAAP